MRSHTPTPPAALPENYAPAASGRLTGAYLIDALIVTATSALIYLLRPSSLLAFTTVIELCVVMTFTRAITGHTPGSLATRTRALHIRQGGAPGLRAQSLHTMLLALMHLTIIGPLLVHLLAKNGQTLPDRMAGIIAIQPAPASPVAQRIEQDAYGRQTVASAAHVGWAAPAPATPAPNASPSMAAPERAIPTFAPAPPSPAATQSTPATQVPPAAQPTPAPQSAPAALPAPPSSFAPPAPTPPAEAPTAAEGQAREQAVQPQPPAHRQHEYWVVFDSGEHAPIVDTLLIGRSPSAKSPNDKLLGVPDPTRSLSRTHLRIVRSRTGLWIDDLGSANGTYIQRPDGTEISVTPGSLEEVSVGCIIHMGERFFHITSPTA